MEFLYTLYILFPLLLIVLFRITIRSNGGEIVSGLWPGTVNAIIFPASEPGTGTDISVTGQIREAGYRIFEPDSARGDPFLSVTERYSADFKNG